MFREVDIKVQSVSDTLGTRNTGQPLEKLVQTQALSLDLREAVMACLSGRESRRWSSPHSLRSYCLPQFK